MQVGAVLGVATYGTTFLSATGVGAHASAHAAVVTFVALAAVNLCAAVWAWRVVARRRVTRVA